MKTNELNIEQKAITAEGKELVVQILRMGDEEGLTVGQAAKLFGVTQQNIKQVCARNGILIATLSCDQRSFLKEAGVLPFRTTRANFLTRQAIKDMLFYIGTPSAKAVYDQLWTMAENPTDAVTTYAEAKQLDPMDVLDKMYVELKRQKKRADDAEDRIANEAVSVIEENGVPAHEIWDKYPKTRLRCKAWLGDNRYAIRYGKTGAITEYLKAQNLRRVRVDGVNHSYSLFSRAAVERLEKEDTDN